MLDDDPIFHQDIPVGERLGAFVVLALMGLLSLAVMAVLAFAREEPDFDALDL